MTGRSHPPTSGAWVSVRKANAGNIEGACAELSRWTYASGKQLPGLVKCRSAPRQLCEAGLA